MKKQRCKKWLFLLFSLILVFGISGTVSAKTKYYSCKDLKVTEKTKGNYTIASLEGNTLTYYKTKKYENKEQGYWTNIRAGKDQQAKLTSKTKYYAADVPQFYKVANFGDNYSYYKVKHLRKLTKAQFFASSSICYRYYGKNYYKDMESSLAITVKNGEITRIVQYGHVAG